MFNWSGELASIKYESIIHWVCANNPQVHLKKVICSSLLVCVPVCVCVRGGGDYLIVSKGNLSLCVYPLYHNSRPGSFNVSEVTMSSDSFAMQNSCLAARKLNNKGEDMMAVTASTARDSYPTSQNTGLDYEEGVMVVSGGRWDSKKGSQFRFPADMKIPQSSGRRRFSAWFSLNGVSPCSLFLKLHHF